MKLTFYYANDTITLRKQITKRFGGKDYGV